MRLVSNINSLCHMGTKDRSDSMSERPKPITERPRLIPEQRKPGTERGADTRSKTRGSLARAVASVKPPQRGVTYRGGPHGGRGVARVPETREATRPLVPPRPPAPPVFVDDTGRRGRVLAWASVVFAMVVLLLVVAFWVSQATSSNAGVPQVACRTAATGHCGVPAGS